MSEDSTDIGEIEASAVGWKAIDAALAPMYAGIEPRHFGTLISWRLGGPDPLQGISAYWREEPVPHWHFITYGFSELYDKEEGSDPEVSGWGFELSFRLRQDAQTPEPPMWPLGLLQNMARYVFKSGNVFEAGHYLNLNGPIALESETKIRSIAFVRDPELPPIGTPNGSLEFLQIVGITLDEEAALLRWSTLPLLELFRDSMPLFVTDLSRDSLLADPALAQKAREGSERDGSRTGMLFVDQLGWSERSRFLRSSQTELVLGARQVATLVSLLPLRLPFGLPFSLIGTGKQVVFGKGERNSISATDARLEIRFDDAGLRAFCAALAPRAGEYAVTGFDALRVLVRKTEIRDQEGRVVETIG